VATIVDRADESGRSADYVEAHRELERTQKFFSQERDDITRRVAGSTQYAFTKKNEKNEEERMRRGYFWHRRDRPPKTPSKRKWRNDFAPTMKRTSPLNATATRSVDRMRPPSKNSGTRSAQQATWCSSTPLR